MEIRQLHPWPTDQNKAIPIQNRFKNKIIIEGALDGVRLVAGADTAFNHLTNTLFAAVCLFTYPDLQQVDTAIASAEAKFPYVPGLHVFREGPVILKAFARLETRPDVVIFAGHGTAHPRRFGMAGHLGLILDIPSVGCARKKLVGHHQEFGSEEGESSPLYVENSRAGLVYRSRANVKPIFISPGHKCTPGDAYRLVIDCLRGYRMPEPLRSAHILAGRIKRGALKREAEYKQTGGGV
jgi:deoxyribonuclease V